MITIGAALQQAGSRLHTSATPLLDAEVLLAHVLGINRARVLAETQQQLSAAQQTTFDALIERRAALEPVAYLTNHKEFYGLDFYVDRRVLVPRPETELLIELALDWARSSPSKLLSIADIGTGSGCLAVTLALKLPQALVYAIDLSPDALAVAALNIERHAVTRQVTLLHGDGCTPLTHPVSLIVANPPYTVLDEIDENVRRWEPHLALDGGAERGFAAVERLLQQMPHCLEPHGAALIEIGAWQGAQALEAAQRIFPGAQIGLHHDLAGLDRVLAVHT